MLLEQHPSHWIRHTFLSALKHYGCINQWYSVWHRFCYIFNPTCCPWWNRRQQQMEFILLNYMSPTEMPTETFQSRSLAVLFLRYPLSWSVLHIVAIKGHFDITVAVNILLWSWKILGRLEISSQRSMRILSHHRIRIPLVPLPTSTSFPDSLPPS